MSRLVIMTGKVHVTGNSLSPISQLDHYIHHRYDHEEVEEGVAVSHMFLLIIVHMQLHLSITLLLVNVTLGLFPLLYFCSRVTAQRRVTLYIHEKDE